MMPKLNDVESFWNSNPCGLPNIYSTQDKKSVFQAVEKERYSKQSQIPLYANFEAYRGKRVLEVGCGIGTDGIQFARHGALYTGADLTDAAVKITKEQFDVFGQTGDIVKLNAEELPFPDNHFDHVYSFGVIQHSPYPGRIVNEIYRVLKPAGTITIMLYNSTSFYYLIEVKIIRRLFFMICDKKNFCRRLFSLFDGRLSARLESYRQKLAEIKTVKKRPTKDEWVSMNTDDVFCPIAGIYSKSGARKLFAKFKDFKSTVWLIDKDSWFRWMLFARIIQRPVERWLESHSGWFRMVQAKK